MNLAGESDVYGKQFGTEPTSTSNIVSFTTSSLSCVAGDATDDLDRVTTGTTSLRYHTMENQLIQNWKTSSVSKETCIRANLEVQDGSALYAFSKLRK